MDSTTEETPRYIASLQALIRLQPKSGSEWGVLAYVLNRDMLREDGTLDELFAMVFHLGSFRTSAEAEQHARDVIVATGHSTVMVVKYGAAAPLTVAPPADVVKTVTVDVQGKLIEMEDSQHVREQQKFEERRRLREEIEEEIMAEADKESIEFYKQRCFSAVKQKSRIAMLQQQLTEATTEYNTSVAAIQAHHKKHPEHESKWLPMLKQRLIRRNELPLYKSIETGWSALRDSILGVEK